MGLIRDWTDTSFMTFIGKTEGKKEMRTVVYWASLPEDDKIDSNM